VPDVYFQKFGFIAHSSVGDHGTNRQTYNAMVNFADGVIGNITDALKARGMWRDTLFVVQSDNGGPSFAGSTFTANNYPLKGTKTSNWEGGGYSFSSVYRCIGRPTLVCIDA
jgi:arylsulfatase I/J